MNKIFLKDIINLNNHQSDQLLKYLNIGDSNFYYNTLSQVYQNPPVINELFNYVSTITSISTKIKTSETPIPYIVKMFKDNHFFGPIMRELDDQDQINLIKIIFMSTVLGNTIKSHGYKRTNAVAIPVITFIIKTLKDKGLIHHNDDVIEYNNIIRNVFNYNNPYELHIKCFINITTTLYNANIISSDFIVFNKSDVNTSLNKWDDFYNIKSDIEIISYMTIMFLNNQLPIIYNNDSIYNITNKWVNLPTPEISQNQLLVINKVVNTKFKINVKMLNLVMRIMSLHFKKDLTNNEKHIIQWFKNLFKWDPDSEDSKVIEKTREIKNILVNAMALSDMDYFCFPAFYDFRGRLYYKGKFLNPQGSIFQKIFLEFYDYSTKSEVTDNNLIDNINRLMYDYDTEKYIKSYNSLLNQELTCNKDSLNVIRLLLSFNDKKNHQFTSYDATASAFQHIGLLLRSSDLLKWSNITSDKYYDAYFMISNELKKKYIEYDNLNQNEVASLNRILNNRKLMKSILVSKLYNSTFINTYKIILTAFKKADTGRFHLIDDEDIWLPDIKSITSIIEKSVNTFYKKNVSLLDLYLKKWMGIYNDNKFIFSWQLTDETKIKVKIMKSGRKWVQDNMTSFKFRGQVKSRLNNIDVGKSKRSIMAHLIQSLDAVVARLWLALNMDKPVYTIHDCFVVLPDQTNKIKRDVLLCYEKVYKENIIYEIEKQLINGLNNTKVSFKKPNININKDVEINWKRKSLYLCK